jgi:glycosyltransferase involved in cell wall biosynthesis
VRELLNYYNNLNCFKKITLLCGVRDELEMKKAEELLKSSTFDVIFYRTFPNYPFFNGISVRHLAKAMMKVQVSESTVFHIRSSSTAYIVYKSVRKILSYEPKVLLDIRGALKEETIDFLEINWLLKKMKILNFIKAYSTLKYYTAISVVSNALKEYVLNHVENKIFVNPCLASKLFVYSTEQRDHFRNIIGVNENEKLLVFSSGGESLWQNNQELINIANKGFKILNLSKVNIDHPNIITKYVKYEEVAGYMSAADLALIIRENNIVNKVASPVKFSEYLCSGLPVISNKNVDVIKQCIEKTGYGLLINSADDITSEAVDKLSSISRKKISEYGRMHFGIESVAARYLKIYNEIVAEG